MLLGDEVGVFDTDAPADGVPVLLDVPVGVILGVFVTLVDGVNDGVLVFEGVTGGVPDTEDVLDFVIVTEGVLDTDGVLDGVRVPDLVCVLVREGVNEGVFDDEGVREVV